ncbi:hypothetical protein ASG22_17115 [Chryseobacterium sp. Leaf405]|uniref:bacteriocin-like protein n=1 Tax=Chryseobacterium sp. Leaf405 TaxID=1736367 RepID=UPI0006F6F527|nr:hypothetical protein [Chryseobacterium sp. Leaf405]KQT20694.1 hypothetical protein ASG22_17115 [Chryseobacterium sp. Leaf405]
MKNFKKLSRNDLKEITGGKKACSVVVHLADGYHTVIGTCELTTVTVGPFHGLTQYCETGLGQLSLSSNGGVSHCND